MSHLELNGCKKRRRGERVFRFNNFCENGHPVEFVGSFRHNVKALLEFGSFERNLCDGMQSWSFQLEVHRHPPIHILLFVVEEPIGKSSNHQCKLCQYVGWGHNMVCNKKYHFILPSKNMAAAFINCEGKEEAVKSNMVELQGHILHGVFHSNGFGHLLCLNGVETGSDLTGQHLMHFWGRLCTGLRARKVSLYDISRKRGLELRLLHAVAYGETWFGRWGYKFGRGSFGVTQPMYQKALEAIQAMPLCMLINHLGASNQDITLIFSRYQTLSDYSLVTLGDLFHFLFELKPRLPKENCIGTYNPGVLAETTSRWSAKRVDMATRAIVEALKRAESRWVSRQEVRDVARAYIGDTGLLDFVLKSLGNHIVGKYLVRRSLNPVTKVLEYSLEDISNIFPDQDLLLNNSKTKARYKITGIQLMKDMRILFKYIFKDQKQALSSGNVFSGITMAARIILDSKYFVKEYCGDYHQLSSKVELCLEGKLKLFCTILLKNTENPNEEGTKNTMPPYESITLKNNATFDELKLEVERSFRELYWGLRSFVIESVVNLNAKGTDLVFGLVEVGRKIIFEGSNKERGIALHLMYENGVVNCIVDCPCGTQEDDGERMISCDICEVWQHTRCVGIPNNEEIPRIFLCSRCEQEIVQLPSLL